MKISTKSTLSFRGRVLQSGYWTLAGYGTNQFMRLVGNLILTRLLFPTAFGLMAIIQIVIQGVSMLADMGLGSSIIQHKRGNEDVFLNTTWTVQVVQGFLIWVVICVLAYPMSRIYNEPLLALMLPIVGLSSVIANLNSTKLLTAQRNLEAARLAQIEVGTYLFGLVFTIYLAWLQRSVWALVWGGLISASLKMIASHKLLHGIKNRFTWDRDVVAHLVRFGRWIMISSVLTFLWAEGGKLLISAVLDMRQLALFTLANTLSLVLWQAMQQLAGRVFFPAYAEVHRTNPGNLMAVLYKVRLAMILPSWGLAVIFVFFGVDIMGVLYDKRYTGSGVMLELLAAGSLASCVWGSYSGTLLATAKVATMTLLTSAQIICQLAGMLIGYYIWGGIGLVVGMAIANWAIYPMHAFVMHKNGLWQPKLDLLCIAASVLVVMAAWPELTQIIRL